MPIAFPWLFRPVSPAISQNPRRERRRPGSKLTRTRSRRASRLPRQRKYAGKTRRSPGPFRWRPRRFSPCRSFWESRRIFANGFQGFPRRPLRVKAGHVWILIRPPNLPQHKRSVSASANHTAASSIKPKLKARSLPRASGSSFWTGCRRLPPACRPRGPPAPWVWLRLSPAKKGCFAPPAADRIRPRPAGPSRCPHAPLPEPYYTIQRELPNHRSFRAPAFFQFGLFHVVGRSAFKKLTRAVTPPWGGVTVTVRSCSPALGQPPPGTQYCPVPGS